jgi:hypothetical protein
MKEVFKGIQGGVENHVNTLETVSKPKYPERRFDHSRFQDEASPQRAKGSPATFQAYLDAMSPQEREAREKRAEEEQRKWDYGTTPEGKRDFIAFLLRSMKKQGKLPPDIDHLWINFPSGWVEYREEPAREANGEPSSSVRLGRTPPQEEWDAYQTDLQAKLQAWRAKKEREEALILHAGDPLYDPMTGDLLLPDEHALSSTSSYLFEGKTRPRRFLPPDSPFLQNAKPLQTEGIEDVPETEYHERLVKPQVQGVVAA